MKSILLASCLLVCHFTFAQAPEAKDTSARQSAIVRDTLIWNDGTVYAGTFVQKDMKTGQVKFMTEDGVMHTLSASSIATIKTVRPIAGLAPAKATANTQNADTIPAARMITSSTYDDHIEWNDPRISQAALRKHRTGLGLSITGGTLTAAGVVMFIAGLATNGQTHTTSTSASVSVGAIGGVGLLSFIVGLPMMISGIVKTNRAEKMAKADRARRR